MNEAVRLVGTMAVTWVVIMVPLAAIMWVVQTIESALENRNRSRRTLRNRYSRQNYGER